MNRKKRARQTLVCTLVVVGTLLSAGREATGDFFFGNPENLGPSFNTDMQDFRSGASRDGLSLYYNRMRTDFTGPVELWVAQRATTYDPWDDPVRCFLGELSSMVEAYSILVETMSGTVPGIGTADDTEMYFSTDIFGGSGSDDLFVMKRETVDGNWDSPTNLGPIVNSPALDSDPFITPDGLTLYLSSMRAGGHGRSDLYVTTRATRADPWTVPTNLGPNVNSSSYDNNVTVSPDGLMLVFHSGRAGGVGGGDIWMARRANREHSWGQAVNLGTLVNSPFEDAIPRLAFDGTMLYFSSDRPGGYGDLDLWQAPIIPIVDFNGDGKIDATDMGILMDNWGRSESLCDIGPFPWGDGIVDEKDLMVLMERLMTPAQRAAEVSCDVALNWTSPEFVDSHDVYFETSFDDVNNATRDDPCSVLVSEGQTETTYDPEGLLEFNQTYYWRVDMVQVVVGSLDPVIYKGPVLSFTTEAFAYPIQNIVATTSGSQPGADPSNTVNGSGLDQNDGHSTSNTDMWQSANAAGPHWVRFEFDQVYALHELWVWNSNQAIESFVGFGAKTVKVEYSTDGTAWTQLEAVPEFARAPGQAGYAHNTVVSFGGVSAKYVRLTIEANWGGVSPSTGLSEVRFFHIPDRSPRQL